MLRDPQLVYGRAEEMAARWRRKQQQREQNITFRRSGGAEAGTVVEGTVLATTPAGGVLVSLGGGAATALIRKQEISNQYVESAVGLFSPGTTLRALVLPPRVGSARHDIFLSTKALEPSPGDMLRDPQLVYDRAEEMAEAWREKQEERRAQRYEERGRQHSFIHSSENQGRKLHEGAVVDVKPHGITMELTETRVKAMLSKDEISAGGVEAAGDVFKVVDKVRACLLRCDADTRSIWLTTKPLETVPGDMLRDPGRVYEQAGAVFETWLEKAPKQEDLVEGVVTGISDEGEVSVAVEGGYRGTVRSCWSFGWRGEEQELVPADEAGGTAAVSTDAVFTDAVFAGVSDPSAHRRPEDPCVTRLRAVVRVGDKIKAMILPRYYHHEISPLALPLSIICLQVTPGDFLRDPQLVYATAEEQAAKLRVQWQLDREERAEKRRAVEAVWERKEQARLAAIAAMKEGDLLEGRIHADSLFDEGRLHVALHGKLKKTKGTIERSETKFRALVITPDLDNGRVLLSTKDLEPTPGDMLRDPQLVYNRAVEMAARWRQKREAQAAGTQSDS
ncbi:hypothetical protein HYH03_011306 [Edaphochlamys debaryana]|uniref:S1 motif domain-containing protein n=1 Tax=Edaphochlamys debaryana TaxID=47281 RepID=A0A835XUZ4_9CHLO|nr:hypothetical protein HYH03_011306 [Edaphochlamys debaryana]|eukprot:KAG2490177.1 hypothetical protein HYH03_011306 [Edaphochlamys debaryana]